MRKYPPTLIAHWEALVQKGILLGLAVWFLFLFTASMVEIRNRRVTVARMGSLYADLGGYLRTHDADDMWMRPPDELAGHPEFVGRMSHYLDLDTRTDGWGRRMLISVSDGSHATIGNLHVVAVSAGLDGKFTTNDDLRSHFDLYSRPFGDHRPIVTCGSCSHFD